MGLNGSKSKEFIEATRFSRQQQVELFSLIVEKNEIETAHHIKDNKNIITVLMHFDATKRCTCASDLEQCLPSGKCSSDDRIENLRTAISNGICPHVESSTIAENLKPSGIYWIHLAIITGKRNLIKILLPYLSNFEFERFVFFTLCHKFSSLQLALLHNNIELAKLFLQVNIENLNCVLNIHSHKTVTAAICKNVKAMKLLWSYLNNNDHRTRTCWEDLLEMCHEYGSSAGASFLHSKGIRLARDILRVQIVAAVSAEDIDRVQLCLSSVEAQNGLVEGLVEATRIGNNEIASLILVKMKSVGKAAFQGILLPQCMINSVLNHNIQVLTTLINYGIDVNTTYYGVSLLSWTKILDLKNIETILTNAGGMSYDTYTEFYRCPLTCLVSVGVNALNNVKILVEKGYDPNGRHMCTTGAPIYTSLREKRYDIFEYLLFQGADLYLKRGALNEFYSKFWPSQHYYDWMKFLIVLVKTNVMFDSCGNEQIMKNLFEKKAFESLLEIILKTSHKLSRSDTDLLRKWETCHSHKIVSWWLHDVKSLQEYCRHSLRRHYGYKFYSFTQKIESSIPTKILKYIRCEDITDQYNTN